MSFMPCTKLVLVSFEMGTHTCCMIASCTTYSQAASQRCGLTQTAPRLVAMGCQHHVLSQQSVHQCAECIVCGAAGEFLSRIYTKIMTSASDSTSPNAATDLTIEAEPLQQTIGGPRRSLTPAELKLVSQFRCGVFAWGRIANRHLDWSRWQCSNWFYQVHTFLCATVMPVGLTDHPCLSARSSCCEAPPAALYSGQNIRSWQQPD